MKLATLSIVMPVYNEIGRIADAVEAVDGIRSELQRRFGAELDFVLIDDGSSDGTSEWLERNRPDFARVFHHDRNRGKGAALRTGFKETVGEIVCIQDADSEYDARAILDLIRPIVADHADVVYGSRYLDGRRGGTFDRYGHKVLNTLIWVATRFRLSLTDMETCQKAISGPMLRSLQLKRNTFTIEVELTLKLFRAGARFLELPIDYQRRVEGKKAKIILDGAKAAFAICIHGAKALAARRRAA